MSRYLTRTVLAVAALVFFATSAMAGPPPKAIEITGDGQRHWSFNPDPRTSTPYELNDDRASLGDGSLHVLPIQNTSDIPGVSAGWDKFIAAHNLNVRVDSFNSLSYDFLIAGNGTSSSAKHFYLNVYTNLPGSQTYYDCRFDYVPSTGSTTDFTTFTVNADDAPTTRSSTACPPTLAQMPANSRISFVTINVGDTSMNDTGLAGYLDNVQIDTDPRLEIYDFES